MYMYLSHRIRRMFLSGACPQNLSPKKPLSLKDHRFLQKTRVDKNLTRTVLKQQKVLYEKHIGFLLQERGFERVMAHVEHLKSTYKTTYRKNVLHSENTVEQILQSQQKEQGPKLHMDHHYFRGPTLKQPWNTSLFPPNYTFNGIWEKTPIYVSVWCKNQKTVNTLANRWSKQATERSFALVNENQPKGPSIQGGMLPLSTPKGHPNNNFLQKGFYAARKQINPAKYLQSNKPLLKPFSDSIDKSYYNYHFNRKPLTVFVQSIKVQEKHTQGYLKKKQIDLSHAMENVAVKESNTKHVSNKLTKGLITRYNPKRGSIPRSFSTQKQTAQTHCFATLPSRPFTTIETSYQNKYIKGENNTDFVLEKRVFDHNFSSLNGTFQTQLAPNSISNYKNCRYLYNRESLKTCIVPQIFKNQKPTSRAKTLLHERKKIALLYGQLAKKDINTISKKAIVTGFFEDNMFTLLESRVDVCVFRAGFSRTIAAARQLIRNGSVLVNGKKISSCKSRAKPGDFFTFTFKNDIVNCYKNSTTSLYYLYLSSNFLTLSKIKYFREKNKKKIGNHKLHKETAQGAFESRLFEKCFEFVPHHYFSQAFCHSLYWGFFIYKLQKIEPFWVKFNCNNRTSPLIPFNPGWDNSFAHNTASVGCSKRTAPTSTVLPCPGGQAPTALPEGGYAPFEHPKGPSQGGMAYGKEKKQGKQNIKNNVFVGLNSTLYKSSTSKKDIVFFNLYAQYMLKKLQTLKTKTIENSLIQDNYIFRKNLSSNNLWAIWGQKPLHLEISHKTGAFIYMYKPQKIISPVCLDWI